MPIYEEEGRLTREDLDKIRRKSKCKECGARLNIYLDPDSGKAFLACWDWLRAHHEGIEREASRYEKEGLESLNLETRREIMAEEHGKEETKALDKYMGGGVITKRVATEIVETLWGVAPLIEKTKAILLCQTYQLNPLMKHLHLVGYKRRDKETKKFVVDGQGNLVLDWSIMIGIGATRLMAQRKHNYSYLDLTPRKATEEEIRKILGDTADSDSIYGFVHIKDTDSGAEAFGLRGIKKSENIKGTEKGNTHLNMACVRAERLALDRQYPGEMPQDVEVVDEQYLEVSDVGKVDTITGEIIEGKVRELPDEPPSAKEHWCEEHDCAFEEKKSRYGTFYAHKLNDGWCNEAKKKEAQTESAEQKEPPEKPKRDPDTLKTFNDLFKACNADFKLQSAQVLAELSVSSQNDISETPAECYRRISAVR